MKNIFNIILFLPLFLYFWFLLINSKLLTQTTKVSLFFSSFEINIILFISIFFVSYILIIYFILKFTNFFVSNKNKNLTEEINKLKAEMQDREPKLLEKIENKFEEILQKANEKNKENIEVLKKENEKILTNLNYDLKMIKEKIEK